MPGLAALGLALFCLPRLGAAQRDGAPWLDALHVRLARQVFNRSVIGHLKPGPRSAGSARPPRTHEFVSTISLGTPPQKLTCLVDTSVSGLWVMPASGCSGCAGRGRFEVNLSSTFSGMTSMEVRAPWYLGDSRGPVWGLPFEDLLGIGPMKLPGQGVNLMTSAPLQAHATKGVDWDSVCGLAWPSEEETAELQAPGLATGMMRTGGHAVFTLAPGLGDRSYVVAGDVPQTIYKQGTLVWEELELNDETRPFWVVPGEAQVGGGIPPRNFLVAREARFLVDTGTSFVYVPPAVLYKDLDLDGALSSSCGLDPAAGNLLVCECGVMDVWEAAQITLTVVVAGRRFALDVGSLFEKVSASDGEDLCLPLLQPSLVHGASARLVELVENVAGGGRRGHRGGGAAAPDASAEDGPGARADDAENLWVLGGAFLERFVVVLDFENKRLGVAEPMSEAAAAMTDPELLWFGSSYKRLEDLDSDGNVMCADNHSLRARCGPCGPDWGDAIKCQALCNSDVECNYVVHSTDGGCRLYSSCEDTVTTAPSGDYSSRMHIYARRTTPFKQVVTAPGALCSPDQRIVVPESERSFDRAACERLCDSHHSCNYFAHLSDGTCMIYKECVQLVTAEGTEASTEIYWKAAPFVFDGEQARTPDRAPSSERGMPWWLLHGVRPTGKKKDSGSFTVSTFSKEQQELYGVNENGEVLDQARFDRELPGVLASGAATLAGHAARTSASRLQAPGTPAGDHAAGGGRPRGLPTSPDAVAPLSLGAPPARPAAAGVDWLSGPGGAAGPKDGPAATTAAGGAAPPAPPAAAGVDWLSGPGGAAGPKDDEPAVTMAGLADRVAARLGPTARASAPDGRLAGWARGVELAGEVEDDAQDESAWFADREVAVVSPNAAARGLRQPVEASRKESPASLGRGFAGGELPVEASPQASREPDGSQRLYQMTFRHAVISVVTLGGVFLVVVYLRRQRRSVGVQDYARESMVTQTPRMPDEEEPCAAE